MLYFLLCFGCPFGTDFCYLWCPWAHFFLSWAPFLGLRGALGPLGLQGSHSRAKKVDFSSVPRRKSQPIWTLSCSFSRPFRRAVFGVVLRWALDTLFGPKGCPSGAKGSFQRPKRMPRGAFWYNFGALFEAFLGRVEIAILQYLQCEIIVFEGPGGQKMCTFCDFFLDCVLEVPFLHKITQKCHQGGAQGTFWEHFGSLWGAMGFLLAPLWLPFWCQFRGQILGDILEGSRGSESEWWVGGALTRAPQRSYLAKAK